VFDNKAKAPEPAAVWFQALMKHVP
jgi:hypothetical protein